MDIRFKALGKRRRDRVRAIAREARVRYPDDNDRAIAAATKQIKTEFVGGIVMGIMINALIGLAAKHILNWAINRVMVPAPTYQPGEPGYEA